MLTDLDGLIIAVAHDVYKELDMNQFEAMFGNHEKMIIGDIKGVLDRKEIGQRNMCVWRL
jgi:UDP-N-acetyl-D-galactosamine dehydrogenase